VIAINPFLHQITILSGQPKQINRDAYSGDGPEDTALAFFDSIFIYIVDTEKGKRTTWRKVPGTCSDRKWAVS